jgi:hypothetical protein
LSIGQGTQKIDEMKGFGSEDADRLEKEKARVKPEPLLSSPGLRQYDFRTWCSPLPADDW